METIAEVGFGHASLARIAKRAGISKGVISYHFAGKDELMEKLVVEFFVAGAMYMIPKIESESTARGKLRAYLESNIDYIAENRTGIAAVSDVLLNLRDADGNLKFLAADDEGHRKMINSVADIFREGQTSGEFREFDPVIKAMQLRASIDMVARVFTDDPHADLEHYKSELVTHYHHATRRE